MKTFDILTKEMTNRELYPMADFLSSLAERKDFVRYVDLLTRGIGIGLEVSGCDFPNDLDEYAVTNENGFQGIRFYSFDESVFVDVPTFRKHLQRICDIYLTEHPENQRQIQEYLARPQPPLEEGALPEWRRRRDAGEYPKPLSEAEL